MFRAMPAQLPKKFRIEATVGGRKRTLAEVADNHHRLVLLRWEPVPCAEVRLVLEEGWSERPMRVFDFEVR